ncbi:MAG: hypothetical protein AAFP23_00745 [Pseudomonadota bacterium]
MTASDDKGTGDKAWSGADRERLRRAFGGKPKPAPTPQAEKARPTALPADAAASARIEPKSGGKVPLSAAKAPRRPEARAARPTPAETPDHAQPARRSIWQAAWLPIALAGGISALAHAAVVLTVLPTEQEGASRALPVDPTASVGDGPTMPLVGTTAVSLPLRPSALAAGPDRAVPPAPQQVALAEADAAPWALSPFARTADGSLVYMPRPRGSAIAARAAEAGIVSATPVQRPVSQTRTRTAQRVPQASPLSRLLRRLGEPAPRPAGISSRLDRAREQRR